MNKKIPIDIDSIKKVNLSDFKIINFSSNQFLILEEKVKHIFDNQLEKLKGSLYYDILLISYKFYLEYVNLIFYLIIFRNIKLSSCYPVISKSNQFASDIFKFGIPKQPLIKKQNLPEVSKFRKLYRRLKFIVLYNKFSLLNFFSRDTYFFLAENNPGLKNISNYNNGKSIVLPIFLTDYILPQNNMEDEEIIEIKKIITSINIEIKNLSKDYDIFLTDIQLKYFFENFKSILISNLNYLKSAIFHLQKQKPKKIFIGCNNNFLSRAFSSAIISNFGKIIGFHHGTSVVYERGPEPWLDLSLNTEIVYRSKIEAEVNNQKAESLRFNFYNTKLIFNHLNQDFFPLENFMTTGVRNIMIISNFYRNDMFSSATSYLSPFQFFIENKLVDLFSNFNVVLKSHFENNNSIKNKLNIIFGKKCFISHEKLNQKMINDNDLFVFYYTRTSIFETILKTSKPIVLFDLGMEKISKAYYDFLKKRCFIINTEFNTNEFNIDQNYLDNFFKKIMIDS